MKRRSWLQWMGPFALTIALVCSSTTSCAPPSNSSHNDPACLSEKNSFSLSAGSYAEVGKLGDTEGDSRPFVVVLDEQHPSRVGQVEIAIMLNRLYHTANLRHLALEGSVTDRKPPNLTWFTSLPDAEIRGSVALRLLREGEVSAAEFAALVLPGFQLHPIEDEDQYQVEMSDDASRSYTGYLVAIAATTMTLDQSEQANAYLDQGKAEEAIQYIIDTNAWTKERDQLLTRTNPTVTTGEMITLGAELEAKAVEVDADVAEYSEGLQAAQKFFTTAGERSDTMVANTADLAAQGMDDCAPIAMNIGAAHSTEVADSLGQSDLSYAVVSPLSLLADNDNGSLSLEAFDRKLNAQSVDPAGALGAILDGRRKPAPTIEQDWFKTKAQLSYASVVITRAVMGSEEDEPPFGLDPEQLGLGGSGPEQANIAIDLSTIRKVRDEVNNRTDVIFAVTLRKQGRTIWVRTGLVAETSDFIPDNQQTMERELRRIRDDLKKETAAVEPPSSGKPPVASLTPDVKIAVGETSAAVEAMSLV